MENCNYEEQATNMLKRYLDETTERLKEELTMIRELYGEEYLNHVLKIIKEDGDIFKK